MQKKVIDIYKSWSWNLQLYLRFNNKVKVSEYATLSTQRNKEKRICTPDLGVKNIQFIFFCGIFMSTDIGTCVWILNVYWLLSQKYNSRNIAQKSDNHKLGRHQLPLAFVSCSGTFLGVYMMYQKIWSQDLSFQISLYNDMVLHIEHNDTYFHWHFSRVVALSWGFLAS